MAGMMVTCLRRMSPDEVRVAVGAFPSRYVRDWDQWGKADRQYRAVLFGKILRKWQATRPRAMRRPIVEARHESPFLEDLLAASEPHIRRLSRLSVKELPDASNEADEALRALWANFTKLPIQGSASCVGISKAVLLLTDGRIGPAFDSRVRRCVLGAGRHIETAERWISVLRQVGEDIRAFEAAHSPLPDVVPTAFSALGYGRLYDMAFGPH